MQSANERRAEILAVMNVRRYDTLDNLAFEFGVSKRTLVRDIQALCMHSPIYTVSGNGGGIFMVDGCCAGRKYLNDLQEELLIRMSAILTPQDRDILKSILTTFAVPKKGERRL